jgi:AbrB family looped-hinge helix DNA binding protein
VPRGQSAYFVWRGVQLEIITEISYHIGMRSHVTIKGQVTIPKELRDRFAIEPGSLVDFVAGPDGIHLRKVIDRTRRSEVLGCLKKELSRRSVNELLDDLRGPVELPPPKRRERRT